MPKKNKEPAIQKSIYVPAEIDEKIVKYLSNTNDVNSYNEVVNLALKEFLKIQANKDDLSLTTKIIEDTIRKELKPTTERMIKLLAKSSKVGYSSMYLQAYVLAYLFNTDDKTEFIKEIIEKAEALGYRAIKNYALDEDISKMLPNDLNINDF